MKRTILFFISILALTFFSCGSIDTNTNVVQKQFDFPVLKLKEANVVLQLKVTRNDTLQVRSIKEIVIHTEGTTNLSDIESVKIYYCAKDSTPSIKINHILFSETSEISAKIYLKGDVELKGSDNYFLVSYKLKDDADILHFVGAVCEKVLTNAGKSTISKLDNKKRLRMGVAMRQHNDDNVHTYRIPGLVTTNEGTLLACYDARRLSSRDLQGDIDIGISRSTNGGNTWEPMRIALDMDEWGGLPQKFNGVSDATLLVNKNTGDIFIAGLWMYGVINKDGKWVENLNNESEEWNHQWRNKGSQPGFGVKQTSQFLIAKSVDDGQTWSKPVNLTKMCKKKEWWLWAPAPGNGITLGNGTLVLPTQGRDKDGLPFSNITYSKDGGVTWKTSTPASTNTTESAIVQLENGSIMINMRDNRNRLEKGENNGRAIAVTYDLGETWAVHPTSNSVLNEPVCMASLHKHEYEENGEKKSLLLFSNPNTREGRHHITLKISFDNGETWPKENWILLDEGWGRGYSCLTSINENSIGILYEGSQADMTYQRISLEEILRKK